MGRAVLLRGQPPRLLRHDDRAASCAVPKWDGYELDIADAASARSIPPLVFEPDDADSGPDRSDRRQPRLRRRSTRRRSSASSPRTPTSTRRSARPARCRSATATIGPSGSLIDASRSASRRDGDADHGNSATSRLPRIQATADRYGIGLTVHAGHRVHLHLRELLPPVRRRADREAQQEVAAGHARPRLPQGPRRADFFDDFYTAARPATWSRSSSFPKEIDVSDGGPYANYNWELFFHIPLTDRRAPEQEPALRRGAALVPLHLRSRPATTRPCRRRSASGSSSRFRKAGDGTQIDELLALLSKPDAELHAEEPSCKETDPERLRGDHEQAVPAARGRAHAARSPTSTASS